MSHEITENSCTDWCVFFSSDFMHVIQDYWSFRSMLEFLGRVHLLQLVAWLPLHSIQLIHLLLAFKEQMQNMLLTSIFDMSDFFFYLVIWNCCKKLTSSHVFVLFASSSSYEMVWNVSGKFWWDCPVLVNFELRRFVVCKLYFLFNKNLIFIFSVVYLIQWESDFYIQCTTLLCTYHLLKLLNCS